jgi:hypothetical protein
MPVTRILTLRYFSKLLRKSQKIWTHLSINKRFRVLCNANVLLTHLNKIMQFFHRWNVFHSVRVTHEANIRGGGEPFTLSFKYLSRGGNFKILRSPGIDSKELIPPAYVALWACTIALFLLSF